MKLERHDSVGVGISQAYKCIKSLEKELKYKYTKVINYGRL
jgi:hypothetical protein